MGVKSFNKIVEKYGKQVHISTSDFNHIVIDGSNLLIRMIASACSIMKNKYKFPCIDLINLDIFQQYNLIIKQTIILCANFIKKLNNENITILIDGLGTPKYEIYYNTSITELSTEERMIPDEILEMKKDEEVRRRENSANSFNSKYNPLVLVSAFPEIDTEQKNVIREIYKQGSLSFDNSNTFCLNRIIAYYLQQQFTSITFIESISEADLVLKYLAHQKEGSILVISADTDYYILCGNLENVFFMNSQIGSSIYQPRQIWMDFLGTTSMEYIARVSCLLGNDFTGLPMIYAQSCSDDIISLFNINHKELRGKKICSIYANIDYKNFSLNALDIAIRKNDESYYQNYIKCITIYMTSPLVNNAHKLLELDLEAEFEYLFNRIKTTRFYKWNVKHILNDKQSFLDSISFIDISDQFEFKDRIEYAELDNNCVNPEDEFFS